MSGARNAFGALCIDPARLTQRERIDVLRILAGRLQAAPDRESQWAGRCLTHWLADGGDLDQVLGIRPPRGSHGNAQNTLRAEARDRLIVRLSVACRGDRAALRALRGTAPIPAGARSIIAELRALGLPDSAAAFTRARTRVSRARR